ncbi:MAG: hypothetical protein VKJ86_06020 [Synechococcus sp.]|nr:hypothetical protein [Synechococcus sp.]
MIFYLAKKILQAKKRNSHLSSVEDTFKKIFSFDKRGQIICFICSSEHDESSLTARFKVRHENGRGEVIVELRNIQKLHQRLKKDAIKAFEAGDLSKANALISKLKNLDTQNFSHRLEIFRVASHLARLPIWIIDFSLKSSLSEYIDKSAIEIIKNNLYLSLSRGTHQGVYKDSLNAIFIQEKFIESLDGDLRDFSIDYYPLRVIYSRLRGCL